MKPTEVKIQQVRVGIDFDDDAMEKEVGDKPIRALPVYHEERILIRTDIPLNQEREELLESILAMIYFQYTAELEPIRPRIMGQLARGLVQVLRDNPSLGTYLTQGVDPSIGFNTDVA